MRFSVTVEELKVLHTTLTWVEFTDVPDHLRPMRAEWLDATRLAHDSAELVSVSNVHAAALYELLDYIDQDNLTEPDIKVLQEWREKTIDYFDDFVEAISNDIKVQDEL